MRLYISIIFVSFLNLPYMCACETLRTYIARVVTLGAASGTPAVGGWWVVHSTRKGWERREGNRSDSESRLGRSRAPHPSYSKHLNIFLEYRWKDFAQVYIREKLWLNNYIFYLIFLNLPFLNTIILVMHIYIFSIFH